MKTRIVNKIIYVLLVMHGVVAICAENAPYEKYVDQIIHEFEREMAREHGLVSIGSGGSMPTSVESIRVIFNVYKRGTIQEARELMVKATTKLVAKVNSHEKIRPYLKEYPFTSDRARISLWFHKKYDDYYLDGSVASVGSARDNKIIYDKVVIETRKNLGYIECDGTVVPPEVPTRDVEVFVPILEESFEEAVRLAQLKQFVK